MYRAFPQVPRIAVSESNLGGLLHYNAVPFRTIFLLSIGKAAQATKNLNYTFGTGSKERGCAFLPYWTAFMQDLQATFRDDQ